MSAPHRGSREPREHADAGGWSLRRRAVVAFSALTVLLVALLIAVGVAMASYVSAGNDVTARWSRAAVVGQALNSELVNQESAVRGYALSALPELLQRYEDSQRRQRASAATLQTLLGDDRQAQQELQTLSDRWRTWRITMADPLVALVQARDPTARAKADSVAGHESFRPVTEEIGLLLSGIDRRSEAAIDERKRAAWALGISIAIAAAATLAAGAAVWIGMHRWVLTPVDRLAGQTREVADGDVRRAIRPAGPTELAALGADVETMRQRITDELDRLELAGSELARSNADLEQFAYVASHDLSEPLRKVANFCQLLERQYGEQLDERARMYIGYAVDGAKRMQVLITDLLSLSRVGRTIESFAPVDLGHVADRVCHTLAARIAETGAVVEHGDLPTVPGDEALLTSLLQNLVGNALKYHGEQRPRVTISATLDPQQRAWTISVADNGIGIDRQYAERIFTIFQRLHVRDEFGGTGIGLALCRKIVESHGGQIWLDTDVRSGATFRFTLFEEPAVSQAVATVGDQ